MGFELRRVVTGHDDTGLAVVKEDEVISSSERLPGYQAITVWCTSQFPVDNHESAYTQGQPGPKGSRVLMRVGEMAPGQSATQHLHRTETLDYAVVLSGQCEMALDSGQVVRQLRTGDVVIQRGTNHGWIVRGTQPVRFLFVLIDAHPVHCNGKVLGDFLDNFDGRLVPMSAA